jgi:hypothetical protein
MDTAESYFLNPNPPKCTHTNSYSLVFGPDNRLYPPDRLTVDLDFAGCGRVISFFIRPCLFNTSTSDLCVRS